MKVRSRRSGQFVGRTMRPDQVAAVCYRHKGSSVQFLLVNTGGGKWTFPKGCVDPQLSAIEAASREAAEEAGVAGSIEQRAFASYLHVKKRESQEFVVAAYLLRVRKAAFRPEAHRNPTWFPPQEAKKRLAKYRPRKYRDELKRIVDRAVERLR
jgi:8-oxo-dGTP pyrophosphatase MutT (NUDIX family)